MFHTQTPDFSWSGVCGIMGSGCGAAPEGLRWMALFGRVIGEDGVGYEGCCVDEGADGGAAGAVGEDCGGGRRGGLFCGERGGDSGGVSGC